MDFSWAWLRFELDRLPITYGQGEMLNVVMRRIPAAHKGRKTRIREEAIWMWKRRQRDYYRKSKRNPSRPGRAWKARGKVGRFRHYTKRRRAKVDPRSIRTIRIGRHGKLMRVGCPKGHWSPLRKRCKVGLKAISLLAPARNPGRTVPPLPGFNAFDELLRHYKKYRGKIVKKGEKIVVRLPRRKEQHYYRLKSEGALGRWTWVLESRGYYDGQNPQTVRIVPAEIEVGTSRPGYRWAPAWKIVDARTGFDVVQPYEYGKGAKQRAVEYAKRMGYAVVGSNPLPDRTVASNSEYSDTTQARGVITSGEITLARKGGGAWWPDTLGDKRALWLLGWKGRMSWTDKTVDGLSSWLGKHDMGLRYLDKGKNPSTPGFHLPGRKRESWEKYSVLGRVFDDYESAMLFAEQYALNRKEDVPVMARAGERLPLYLMTTVRWRNVKPAYELKRGEK